MNFRKDSILVSKLLVVLMLAINSFAADLYWVGNSGNWNDASHWSTISGGNGGEGVPTINDNVIINEQSFNQTGVITVQGNIKANSFSFSATQTVNFSSQIAASFQLAENFSVNDFFVNDFFGKIIFTSNQDNSFIKTSRTTFLGDVEFNGSGSWNMMDDFILTDSNYIYLKQGEIIANNISIYTGGVITEGNASKKLTLIKAVLYNHEKALFNAPNFSYVNTASTLIVYRKASEINLGNIDEKTVTMSNGTTMRNPCGSPAFTLTTTVITNYNGFGVSC